MRRAWRPEVSAAHGVRGGLSMRMTAVVAVAAGLAMPLTATAQVAPGDASSGLRFAETWCSGCHPISLTVARTGGIAPDFRTIANRPSTNAAALRTFLDEEHSVMPNFKLTPDEASDIVAYILSLRRDRGRN